MITMFSYQLDFEVNEGNINTFLIGSKNLFEKINVLEHLLANSIDVEIEIEHKLIELENKKISYQVDVDIKYPQQHVLGVNIDKNQIDQWFNQGLKLILENRSLEECIRSIDILAEDIKLNLYLLYIKIPDNILKKSLDDLEKLSILLFNKLVFFEM
jgi:hypothetical protein